MFRVTNSCPQVGQRQSSAGIVVGFSCTRAIARPRGRGSRASLAYALGGPGRIPLRMWDAADDLAAALERLLSGVAGALAGASPGWLALGVALHVANQIARGRGWHAIVRTAAPADPACARRDAMAAWVAGAGAGGMVSARGGDAVRVLLLPAHAAAPRLPAAGRHARGRGRG